MQMEKKKARVFGATLEDICKRENKTVPTLVTNCVEFVSAKGLETEGIFRLSGTKTEVDEYKKQTEEGKDVPFKTDTDPNVVTGVLKKFLREMPVPLLTFDLYDEWMDLFSLEMEEKEEQRIQQLKVVFQKLPELNRNTLVQLLQLCQNILKKVDVNKMTASNLSLVLGPNLIYRKEANPLMMKSDLDHGNSLVEMLINYYDFLSGKEKQVTRKQTEKTPPMPPTVTNWTPVQPTRRERSSVGPESPMFDQINKERDQNQQ